MQWTVHGEETIYDNEWVRLTLVDVEIPGGARFAHHVVRAPSPAAGTVIYDPARGVLLMWRHRFIADAWGWEIPAGKVEDGETLQAAAQREALEETGWEPGPMRHLTTFFATIGFSDQRFAIFLADGATHVGDPSDPSEADRIEWMPVDRLQAEITAGRVVDGLSLNGLLYAMTFGHIS